MSHSPPPPVKNLSRALTQKYDMYILRKIQALDDEILSNMAEIHRCEEDDIKMDIDSAEILNQQAENRRSALKSMLVLGSDTDAIQEAKMKAIASYLVTFEELDNERVERAKKTATPRSEAK